MLRQSGQWGTLQHLRPRRLHPCGIWNANRYWRRLNRQAGTAGKRRRFWEYLPPHYIAACAITIWKDDDDSALFLQQTDEKQTRSTKPHETARNECLGSCYFV